MKTNTSPDASASAKPTTKSFCIPAMPIKQGGGGVLLLGRLSVPELLSIARVDHFDGAKGTTDPDNGYQRPEDPARVRSMKRYIAEETKDRDLIVPTSFVLCCRTPWDFDEAHGLLTVPADGVLYVVDGQHRLAGFREVMGGDDAALKKKLEKFDVPVVILNGYAREREMTLFADVNGNAKSVRTDLVRMILSKLMEHGGEEAIRERDQWKVALARAVEYLNKEADGVWKDCIVLPDQQPYSRPELAENPSLAKQRFLRATSFMHSLKPLHEFLSQLNLQQYKTKSIDEKAHMLAEIIQEFWKAVKSVNPEPFENPRDYVLQRSTGVFTLNLMLKDTVAVLYEARLPWGEANFRSQLERIPDLKSPEYWHKDNGQAAMVIGNKGYMMLAKDLWRSRR
jgi:DGQHR domain-containing protein